MCYEAATRCKSQSSSCSNLHRMQLLKGWRRLLIGAHTLHWCCYVACVEDQCRALDVVVCRQCSYCLQSLADCC